MNHEDHVNLLRKGVPGPGGVWADFGSGRGAFTLALAELIGPTGVIYSVDKDRRALRQQEKSMRGRFPEVTHHTRIADFTKFLQLPELDGIVMANALHFVRHKETTVKLMLNYLKPGGRLLLVEYNTDRGNYWVPHPLSYLAWARLAQKSGFARSELLAVRPSRFLGEIFSAVSYVSDVY
jgi:ubiquinone/menaquinone biosynthesis C-methylase UbiE